MTPTPLTLVSLLDRAGALFADREIVAQRHDYTTHRYTYRDFRRRALSLGAALQESGLRRGDRVATLMWNHHIHLEACFGVPIAGGVIHPLNLRQSVEEIARSINRTEDRFLIVDDELLPLFERVRRLVNVDVVVVAPSKGGSLCHRYEAYEDLLDDCGGEPDDAALGEDTPAVICDPSNNARGATGVVFTHQTIALYAYSISSPGDFSIEGTDAVLPALPMCHASAWGMPYAAMMQGSRLVLPGPQVAPEPLLDLMAAHEVTLANASLPVWLTVLDVLERAPDRWPQIRRAHIVVSGPSPYAWLSQRFRALGIHVVQPPNMADTARIASGDWLRAMRVEGQLQDEWANKRAQG